MTKPFRFTLHRIPGLLRDGLLELGKADQDDGADMIPAFVVFLCLLIFSALAIGMVIMAWPLAFVIVAVVYLFDLLRLFGRLMVHLKDAERRD